MRRRRPAGEARHRKIETPPEEVHRARLAEEAAAEELEDAICLNEHAPERVCRARVIGGVDVIAREWNCVRDLVRRLDDAHVDAHAAQELEDPPVKVTDRLRLERQGPFGARARAGDEPVRDEVELDLEDLAPEWDRRGAESARRHVERHLPTVVEPGSEREPHLADDLRPQLQGRGGIAPGGVGKRRPGDDELTHTESPVASDRRTRSSNRRVRIMSLRAAKVIVPRAPDLRRRWNTPDVTRLSLAVRSCDSSPARVPSINR